MSFPHIPFLSGSSSLHHFQLFYPLHTTPLGSAGERRTGRSVHNSSSLSLHPPRTFSLLLDGGQCLEHFFSHPGVRRAVSLTFPTQLHSLHDILPFFKHPFQRCCYLDWEAQLCPVAGWLELTGTICVQHRVALVSPQRALQTPLTAPGHLHPGLLITMTFWWCKPASKILSFLTHITTYRPYIKENYSLKWKLRSDLRNLCHRAA